MATLSRCSRSDHAVSRRALLGSLAAGPLGLGGLGGFDRLFGADAAAAARRDHKHVILIWQGGGASQFETWDPKPGTPTGGPHLAIPTSIPGIHFDEYMPRLAKLANRMVTIRSMTTKLIDHGPGAELGITGYEPKPSGVVAAPPDWLCAAAHELELADGSLPAYVNIRDTDQVRAGGAGFLGAKYAALRCPGNGAPPEDMPTFQQAAAYDPGRRELLRSRIGERFAAGRDRRKVASHEQAFAQMSSVISSSKLFDISGLPATEVERYGGSIFGRDCLLARQLVEGGVPFVRVSQQFGIAWDKHNRAFESQRHITTEFDLAVGALVQDLIDRGLWSKTLVICMGEFGRTPTINAAAGRDHWIKGWSMMMGGGGAKEGVVVGKTNELGTEVVDRPVTLHDLFCTFFTLLGLDPHQEIDFQGRPTPLVEDKQGTPMPEVV